jgi:fimbrial chaperone protein
MKPSRFRQILLFCLLMLVSSGDVLAAAFSISPTRLLLEPGERAAAMTLTNNADARVTVQVETFAWNRTESIADLDPTNEIIAVPPFFDIDPGARQVIRVGLRKPHAGDVERAYRVVVSEVPANDPEAGLGVQFALRLSLPVFITPPGARPEVGWQVSREEGGLALEVRNDGRSHIRLLSMAIRDPAAQSLIGEHTNPLYLLAGQQRRVVLPAKAGVPGDVLIKAKTSHGDLEVTRAVR